MKTCFPTGTFLDLPHCPGIPAGGVVHLYGGAGTGKTTIGLQTAAEAARCGWATLYADWQSGLTPDWASYLGVPLHDKEQFIYCTPADQEAGLSLAVEFLKSKFPVLLVLDGAGTPANPFASEARIEVKKLWAQLFPPLRAALKKNGSGVLLMSTAEKSLGTSGKFYADRSIQLEKSSIPDEVVFTVHKDKLGPNSGHQGVYTLPNPTRHQVSP